MFFDDLIKKVTGISPQQPLDIFDKGYAYSAPFTFKMSADTSYDMGFNYKGEFVHKDDKLDIDWEYKFRYNYPSCLASVLFSNKKAELESECWSHPKKYTGFKAKLGIKPKEKEGSSEGLLKYWDINSEAEIKYRGIKHFYGSLKLAKAYDSNLPAVTVAGVYKIKPQGMLLGASCTFDEKAPKPFVKPLELLLGLKPHKNMLLYVKHSTANTIYPGKFTAGMYRAGAIEIVWPKMKQDKIIDKVYQYRVQTAAEGSIDMQNDNEIKGKVGIKVLTKRAVTFQTMLDSDKKWSSAFTYRPSTKLNFIFSGQVDFKKYKKNPKKGFSDCGFTMELSC
eukprot:TRINITY_DN4084_c0_g3_i1.p1 TRINITY_DN4084_c0_g3~~TRINITY_DN4084_c0_g3_i1.p1  ORF type:complete len:336 (+),score=103.35 TRINITY_DN4084_c0_g3_i1:74-1081(+)